MSVATQSQPQSLLGLVGVNGAGLNQRFLDGNWKLQQLDLEGNEGGKIPSDALGWLKPLPATATDEEIRAAYRRDGVVHVRGCLDREMVMSVREKYFEKVSSTGVLKEGTSPREGIFCGKDPLDFMGPGVAAHTSDPKRNEYLNLSTEAGRSDFINDFAKNEGVGILKMVRRIENTWKEPIVYKRQLMRSNIPGSLGTSTKVHYDQIFLREAPPTSLTAWIPLGDISPISGGLLYLENSVPLGKQIEKEFNEHAAHLGPEQVKNAFNVNMNWDGMLSPDPVGFAEQHGKRWLVGDYRAGDVVFHHPCMIHCSANNEDPMGRIRLATDLRFADKQAPYDHRWADNYYYPNDGL